MHWLEYWFLAIVSSVYSQFRRNDLRPLDGVFGPDQTLMGE